MTDMTGFILSSPSEQTKRAQFKAYRYKLSNQLITTKNRTTATKEYGETYKMIKPSIDSKVITLRAEVDEYFQIQLYQLLLKSIACLLTF